MAPKDKDHILKKVGSYTNILVIRLCDEEYIGKSARLFAERFKEHQKAPSPIGMYHFHHDQSMKLGILTLTCKGH